MQKDYFSQHRSDGSMLGTTRWQPWAWEASMGNKGRRPSQRCTLLLFALPQVRADIHTVREPRPWVRPQVGHSHITIKQHYPVALPPKARRRPQANLRVSNLPRTQISALHLYTINPSPQVAFCNITFRMEDRQKKSACLHLLLRWSAQRPISSHLLAILQKLRLSSKQDTLCGAWILR